MERAVRLSTCLTLYIAVVAAQALAADPPTIGGCDVFPPDNIWNTRVDTLPLHPLSEQYINTIGSNAPLHPDFGSGLWPPASGALIGIPFSLVSETQAFVDISFTYADESDPGPYPIPPYVEIEGGTNSAGDRHIIILETNNCILYEAFAAYPNSNGTWRAGSGAIFNLASNNLRPETWTSADAAGLPILPGLVRFEEIEAGSINHAIRFTVPVTQRAYLWPARHFASSQTAPEYPPMGLRIRLKQSYNIAQHDATNRIILKALRDYGLILSDNGSAMFMSGAPDERWDNDGLSYLNYVEAGSFEAVDASSLRKNTDSAAVNYPTSSIAGFVLSGTNVQVSTDGLYPGVSYAVEKTTNLVYPNWNTQLLFESTGISACYPFATETNAASIFYRITTDP